MIDKIGDKRARVKKRLSVQSLVNQPGRTSQNEETESGSIQMTCQSPNVRVIVKTTAEYKRTKKQKKKKKDPICVVNAAK